MSRVLVVTWDGAGNQMATLGVVAELVAGGHDVRLLGHPSVDARVPARGWRFRAFGETADYDATAEMDPSTEFAVMGERLWFSSTVARDVLDELDAEPADLLLADCMLFGALCAGEAVGLPTVALFHAPFSGFRGGPMVEMLAPAIPMVNDMRAMLGLSPVERLSDVHDRCARSIAALPREFEPDMPLPDNVRFVGPVLGGPSIAPIDGVVKAADGPDPLVLVSLSTSFQDQLPLLQRLVTALEELPVRAVVTTGPAVDPASVRVTGNTQVVRFVAHDTLLPAVSLVVTHAGLGTVLSSLSQGVPMLCLPMGRDQFFNASRVEMLGAGSVLPADAAPAAIVAAVQELLGSDRARTSAKHFATVIAGYGGAADAVRELESLLAD
jgi:MGT family glycosyltransferase